MGQLRNPHPGEILKEDWRLSVRLVSNFSTLHPFSFNAGVGTHTLEFAILNDNNPAHPGVADGPNAYEKAACCVISRLAAVWLAVTLLERMTRSIEQIDRR